MAALDRFHCTYNELFSQDSQVKESLAKRTGHSPEGIQTCI